MNKLIKNAGRVLLGVSVLASGGYASYGTLQTANAAPKGAQMEVWQQTDAAGNLIPDTEIEVANEEAASSHFSCSEGPNRCAVRLNPDGTPSSTYLFKS